MDNRWSVEGGRGFVDGLPVSSEALAGAGGWMRAHLLVVILVALGSAAVLAWVSGRKDKPNWVEQTPAPPSSEGKRTRDWARRAGRGLHPKRVIREAASSWRTATLAAGAGWAGWASWAAGVVGTSVGKSLNQPG